MRIDRSDPADGADDAHMTLPAPDDLGVTGKAATGDGPPDSPLARPDSATRTAYQAKVNAVNRSLAVVLQVSSHGLLRAAVKVSLFDTECVLYGQ